MELRRDIQLAIGVFLAFLLLTAFAAIGLLDRMAPAIKRILHENVASVTACEDMLHVVALADGEPLDVEQASWLESALDRARLNVTEPSEQPLIEELARLLPQVVAADAEARRRALAALRQLATINRDAMYRADARAQRAGVAGIWSMVFLALIGFAAGIGISRRFGRRLLLPLSELYQVFEAVRLGDRQRRCAQLPAPVEIASVMSAANVLLDRCALSTAAPEAERQQIDRAAALQLLEAQPEAMVVVDAMGEVILANQPALDALSSATGAVVRAALQQASATALPAGLARVTPLKDVNAWLCELPSA